jgi:hypothetical protein
LLDVLLLAAVPFLTFFSMCVEDVDPPLVDFAIFALSLYI